MNNKKTKNDIKKSIQGIIKKILKDNGIQYSKIILFGSRARGSNKKNSDFDLLIETDKDVPRDIKMRVSKSIRKKLAEFYIKSGINAGTDIIIKSKTQNQYLKKIPGSLVNNAFNEAVEI